MSEAPKAERRETFRELGYLFTFMRPYRRRFIGALIASAVSMSFGVLFPWLAGHLVDASIPSIKQPGPGAWRPGIDTIAAVMVGTLIIQSVLTFFSSFSFQKTGELAVADLRMGLFSRILALPMRFFGERRVGELASRPAGQPQRAAEVRLGERPFDLLDAAVDRRERRGGRLRSSRGCAGERQHGPPGARRRTQA